VQVLIEKVDVLRHQIDLSVVLADGESELEASPTGNGDGSEAAL